MEIVVRPFTVEDASTLHEAIISSIEHLRPWMPWIALEPLTFDQRLEWLRGVNDSRGVFLGDECVGGTGLHERIGPAGLEIGYWVRASQLGRGIATEAARQMTDLALATPGIDHVEIHHDKANARSRRVPEKLGYTLVREIPDEVTAPGECGISCEWRLRRG